MSKRALELHRNLSQIECDAKNHVLAIAYGRGKSNRRAHVTKTSSRRVGRRAAWLRVSALLRLLQSGVVIDGKVVSGVASLRSATKTTNYPPALFR